MFKYKNSVFIALMLLFLTLSLSPTVYEISKAPNLKAKNRDFVLEHNYYWPDFNLYLSKVRQGYENRWLAVEKYTTEPHPGSLIQIFYLYLGKIGSLLQIEPSTAYQLGRIILSPLLLIIILTLVSYYFRSYFWQLVAFLVTVVSGSFPRLFFQNGNLKIERYMEWWSNIDSLQRITFIPHILFGQITSFYLLYKICVSKSSLSTPQLIISILLSNLAGLVFPPSQMTLLGVIILLQLIYILKNKFKLPRDFNSQMIFIIFSLPSLFYLFVTTKTLPWSALVDFHRIHPMMVPFDQYILGTGPVIIFGFLGSISAILNRQKNYYPLILWVVTTFLFASLFSIVKEQSPLRFTQTGLFIPLGILSAYFFHQLSKIIPSKILFSLLFLYVLVNLVIMQTSLKWQLNFISQRNRADYPAVPYPPQTMYPLTDWMDGIRWLKNNTDSKDVVLGEITAGNFIPAYAGNFVYFGQSNTVDYDRKLAEVDAFFRGQMSPSRAQTFLKNGRIRYIFVGPQEQEKLGGKKLDSLIINLRPVFTNKTITIYKT